MNVITDQAYRQHRWDCLQANGSVSGNTDGLDRVGHCQNLYNQYRFWEIQLQSGLYLMWIDEDYHQDLCIKVEHPDGMPLIAKFYLSGEHGVQCPRIPGVPTEYCEVAGQSYFFSLPDVKENEINLAGQRVRHLRLVIEPCFLQGLGVDLACLPSLLRRTLTDDRTRFHRSLGMMTPDMQKVLQQILHCPYRSGIKRLFLESKALELLTLQLDQWVVLEQGERPAQGLKAADVERVYEAATILLRELANPPSVIALARRVGLNDNKLKAGFRQVFDTTVFGYVRAQRLEQARELLLAGDITVTQAALAVGYVNQGHFAAAFRKRFGVNPRQLRQ